MLDDVEAILDRLVRSLEELRDKGLKDSERFVLWGLLQGLSYQELSRIGPQKGFRYKATTLKNEASKLYRDVGRLLGQQIKKNNFRSTIQAWYTNSTHSALASSPLTAIPSDATLSADISWGTPPVLPSGNRIPNGECLGREAAIAELITQINAGCRLIVVHGPPKIGKTVLARAVYDRIQPDFDHPLRFVAAEVPTLESLYRRVHREIGLPTSIPDPTADRRTTSRLVPDLLDLFSRYRILLVIDGVEALLRSNPWPSRFEPDTTHYADFLHQFLESHSRHQSCLIWVGRERLPGTAWFQPTLYSFRVPGLEPSPAQALLQTQGLLPAPEWPGLLALCGGNPGWLQCIAQRLARIPSGEIAAFLEHPNLLDADCEPWLQALEQFSPEEKTVLLGLALQPMTEADLGRLFPQEILPHRLPELLERLSQRGYLQSSGTAYQLHPPVLRQVVAKQAVEQHWQDLSQGRIDSLRRYPLLLATAPAYQQAWQRRALLLPLVERLRQQYPSAAEQRAFLASTLEALKQQPPRSRCYGPGSLINLAGALQIPLAGLAFNDLTLCQADLRSVNLQNLSGQHCHFEETVFPEGLTSPVNAALSPDGTCLVISDATGQVLRWRRTGERLKLEGFAALPQSVTALHCGSDGTVVLAAGERVYQWDSEATGLRSEDCIREAPGPISCVTRHPNDHIAVGLTTGRILIWDDLGGLVQTSLKHGSEINNLAFRGDGRYLASRGRGRQIQLWDLLQAESPLEPCPPIKASWRIFLSLGWDPEQLLLAEVHGAEVLVQWRKLGAGGGSLAADKHPNQWLKATAGEIVASAFSPDCRYLVGSSNARAIYRWEVQTGTVTVLPSLAVTPVQLAISNDGCWLLTNARTMPPYVQLWQVEKQQMIWSVGPVDQKNGCNGLDLQSATGFNSAEQALLRHLGCRFEPAETPGPHSV